MIDRGVRPNPHELLQLPMLSMSEEAFQDMIRVLFQSAMVYLQQSTLISVGSHHPLERLFTSEAPPLTRMLQAHARSPMIQAIWNPSVTGYIDKPTCIYIQTCVHICIHI